nr:hypothetical protein [Bacteroidota bacterium]
MKKCITGFAMTLAITIGLSAITHAQNSMNYPPALNSAKSQRNMPDAGIDAGSAKGYFSFVALLPADDSIGVGLRSNLHITFDRDVVPTPGQSIDIYHKQTQMLIESIPSENTMIDGSEVTINPVNEFYLSSE